MDYVYLWVDGIHVNIRLEERRPVTRSARRELGGSCRVLRSGAQDS
jgi:hypothetical protein